MAEGEMGREKITESEWEPPGTIHTWEHFTSHCIFIDTLT